VNTTPSHPSACCATASTGKVNNEHKCEGAFPLIWASGSSVCITSNQKDFVLFSKNSSIDELSRISTDKVQGVEGEGTILCYIGDIDGNIRDFYLLGYYVLSTSVRLLCVNTILTEYKPETMTFTAAGLTLNGIPRNTSKGTFFASFNVHLNLPKSIARNMHIIDKKGSLLVEDMNCVNLSSNSHGHRKD